MSAHVSSLSASLTVPVLGAVVALATGLGLMDASAGQPLTEADLRLIDVAGELDRAGRVGSSAAGGVARQAADARSSVRFFRERPSDRPGKADARRAFYLEDAFSPVRVAASRRTVQLLSAPPDEAAERVSYFVDGDLHVDSYAVQAFVLGGYQQMELVVRGDVIIADDVLAADGTHVSFTAIKREDGSGGDIVLDDARFGTLELVEADLHAEGRIVATGRPTVRGVVADGVWGR
jgi:hypothetical protein